MPDRAEQARRARAAKASALADLKNRKVTVGEALWETPAGLTGATIWEVLCHCPSIGEVKAKHILQSGHVWPLTRMCSLTSNEKQLITRELPEGTR